jgi:hypothetical protein
MHGIFAIKHFEINHQFESRISGLNKRKMGLKSKDRLLKKRSSFKTDLLLFLYV